ncbi:MAG: PAS domain-containing protein, partial [Deltaproteobacteria bacterium]|nr:PAS domain-containing protein [Deltaproteobacteria bacterium]
MKENGIEAIAETGGRPLGRRNSVKVSDYFDINSDTILNSIADGVIVIGLDHAVLFVNRAAREILGRVGAEEMLSTAKCGEIFGHSGCTFGCLINSTIKTGEHLYNYEVKLEKNGRSLTLSINTALLKDKDNNVIGGIEIFRDVSLIKELKDELKGRYSFENII